MDFLKISFIAFKNYIPYSETLLKGIIMDKVIKISNTISAVSGAIVSVGILVYFYKVGKAVSNDYTEEKDQVKK